MSFRHIVQPIVPPKTSKRGSVMTRQQAFKLAERDLDRLFMVQFKIDPAAMDDAFLSFESLMTDPQASVGSTEGLVSALQGMWERVVRFLVPRVIDLKPAHFVSIIDVAARSDLAAKATLSDIFRHINEKEPIYTQWYKKKVGSTFSRRGIEYGTGVLASLQDIYSKVGQLPYDQDDAGIYIDKINTIINPVTDAFGPQLSPNGTLRFSTPGAMSVAPNFIDRGDTTFEQAGYASVADLKKAAQCCMTAANCTALARLLQTRVTAHIASYHKAVAAGQGEDNIYQTLAAVNYFLGYGLLRRVYIPWLGSMVDELYTLLDAIYYENPVYVFVPQTADDTSSYGVTNN